MAIKKYNLAGLNANVELGKQGSYISANANTVAFYTNTDTLQKVSIANATSSNHAITKAQLDSAQEDLLQHFTLSFDYNNGVSNIANVSAGSRIVSITVDIPTPWGGTADNTTTYVEVGDTSNPSRYIRSTDADVLIAGQYHSQYQYEYNSDSTLQVNVTQGSASSGTATVSVLLSTGIVTVTDYGSVAGSPTDTNDLGNIS